MVRDEALDRVFEAVLELDIDGIAPAVSLAMASGVEPQHVLNQGLGAGVRAVGDLFETGEYFLTDLVLAGEVMKAGLVPLEPHLSNRAVEKSGTVVLATVKGDIHEIGRSLVGTMLTASGFRVIDLGVDVAPERIVRAVREEQADIVGLSVLLTPMVGQVRTVVEELVEAGLRPQVRVVIGGACTTPELAESMGCDGHGADAVAAVQVCEALLPA